MVAADQRLAATIVACITLGVICVPATAQELEPRTYANTAVGVNVIGGGVSYSFRPGFWLGATIAYPFNAQHGISVTIGSDLNQGFGADFDTIAVAYRYAWGQI
ncbi:MAG: hypothetical protein KJO76_00185 [Gammaproteobacteria bacterium]|nr:hypothetical protein [Gammaproteobacteria bacterium]MBT8444395.1 hypothetical protein [Gammaproteobacteria bacterium]NND36594.1 hypothetical protein [Gammaproteobacteria bacterium]